MRKWNVVRAAGLATCLSAMGWFGFAAYAADISGSIRFAADDFAVELRTTGRSLVLNARGCNNVDLALAQSGRASNLLLFSSTGRQIGSANASKLIEVRTCGSDHFANEIIFTEPTLTRWTPQADESRGTTKIAYAAVLPAREIRFDPAVQLTVFDRTKRARPLRVANVSRIALEGNGQLLYSSEALHFSTPAGTITKQGGFANGDSFELTSDGKALPLPKIGEGSTLTFASTPDQPTRLSVYYPSRGPHTLAFFKDDAQRTATFVASFRIDGRQLLTPDLVVLRVAEIALERGPFDLLTGKERVASGSLAISLGHAGQEVRDVRIASDLPSVLSLATTSTPGEHDALTLDSIPGGTPLELALNARIPNGWAPGEHTLGVNVSAEGGVERRISIPVRVADRYANARIAILAVIAALVLALVFRAVAKRRRAQAQDAAVRARFIQQHYDDYVRTRERIETLLANEPQWTDAQAVLDDFTRRNLHTALAPQHWSAVTAAAQQQKARETLEGLDGGIGKLLS